MASVYIESSVISYMTARPSRDLVVAAHQQVTADWWAEALPQIEPFVSELVLAEIAQGDAAAAAERLNQVADMQVLQAVEDVDELASLYATALGLPERVMADAYHMALATQHGMDYLVSWNCAHIASARVQKTLFQVNNELGLATPVLCTPEELMEV